MGNESSNDKSGSDHCATKSDVWKCTDLPRGHERAQCLREARNTAQECRVNESYQPSADNSHSRENYSYNDGKGNDNYM